MISLHLPVNNYSRSGLKDISRLVDLLNNLDRGRAKDDIHYLDRYRKPLDDQITKCISTMSTMAKLGSIFEEEVQELNVLLDKSRSARSKKNKK